MTAKLAPGRAHAKTKSGSNPLVNETYDGIYHCADAYATLANVAGGLAIGNCPENEEVDVEDYGYGGEKSGYFYGTYLTNIGACAWVKVSEGLTKNKSGNQGHCSGGIGFAYGTFYSQINSESAEDGYYVVNHSACEEYANVRPWSTETPTSSAFRTVPAYEKGKMSGVPALKWRYVTRNGKWVMVRDARIEGGSGNWVFVPRSCLPATLPSSDEALPSPPTATTGGYSNVMSSSALLAGSINPNGAETHYYIEWGKEASKPYENFAPTPYPGEGVGGGKETVNRSVTAAGLSANTVYYYRLVASSPTGTSEGGTGSFKTLPNPPVATIEAASEKQETSAQLNGQVNPNGSDTHYYFEYGPTTSYGTRIPAGEGTDLGSGNGAIHTWNVVSGLAPGTTYHYRLVATSSGGTSETHDETFKTLGGSSPFVTHDATTHQEWVYYRGSDGGMWQLYYEPTSGKWAGPNEFPNTSGKVAAGTSPFVTHDPTTHQEWVYYQGTDGGMWQIYYEPTSGKWEGPNEFPNTAGKVAAGTSPFVTHDSTTHQEWVYYEGSDGGMWQIYYEPTSGKWEGPNEFSNTSGKVAADTNPFVTYDPTTHQEWVYYEGTDGGVWQLYYEPTSGKWEGPNEFAGT